jgi:hypothetical protein
MAPVYFPGNGSNEVETADGNPILFDSGEPYTIALLILWTEDPGNEGIFRSGSANTGNWLWMLSGGRLWGRQANVNSSASGSGPLITAGWHTLARVWDGREVRQYVDGVRTNTARAAGAARAQDRSGDPEHHHRPTLVPIFLLHVRWQHRLCAQSSGLAIHEVQVWLGGGGGLR